MASFQEVSSTFSCIFFSLGLHVEHTVVLTPLC